MNNYLIILAALFYMATGYGHDIQEWKENPFFAENAGYSNVIKEGTSMHPQAIEQILPVVAKWLDSRKKISLLDLACGTETPVVPYMLAQKLNIPIDYTGIDINRSLETAYFSFPDNVVKQTLIVDNAYQVNFPQEKFALIYSGLNLHHLNPWEFTEAIQNYKQLLEPNGIFIIFDLFRPSQYAYLSKPKNRQMADSDWREVLVKVYAEYARTKQMDEETISQVVAHILENDYPMSMDEAAALLSANGYLVETHPFYNFYPDISVSSFFGMLVCKVKGGKNE